jgi:hypothetical protein
MVCGVAARSGFAIAMSTDRLKAPFGLLRRGHPHGVAATLTCRRMSRHVVLSGDWLMDRWGPLADRDLLLLLCALLGVLGVIGVFLLWGRL